MAAEKRACMIIGAVPVKSREFLYSHAPGDCYVICADAGYETAERFQLSPDLIVGDFDSAAQKPADGERVITLPVEKDLTDTMFAAAKGLSLGYREFVLLGCLGGRRFDQNMASLETLWFLLEHGARAELADEHSSVFLLRDDVLRMTGMRGGTVSVFPYGCLSCTVSYEGMQYPLERGVLELGKLPMGVSNRITEDTASVSVHAGTALIAVYRA